MNIILTELLSGNIPMKIAIDISSIIYGTGVSVYTRNLIQNLLEIDTKNDYILFGGSLRRRKELKSFVKNLEGRFVARLVFLPPTLADFFSNRLNLLSAERLVGNIDVYHSSDWAQFKSRAFNVTTIHDLSPILFPKQTHPKIVAVHRRRLEKVLKEANRVIVPSLATKKDLVNFGIKEDIIRIIPEAQSLDFSKVSAKEVARVKKKFRLHGNYSLSVGTAKRKNLDRIIASFEKVRSKVGLGQHVIVGIGEVQDDRGVRFTGHVSERELIALYKGASVLIHASLYEGFGLPILEAFAAGVPVVTSNVSSMPEVADDAAILINPLSVEDITEGIEKAIAHKKDLIYKGRKRLSKFNWKFTARETLKVYEESKEII